jgi:hypothetical protein
MMEVVGLAGLILVLISFVLLAIVLVCQHIDIQSLENRSDHLEARLRRIEQWKNNEDA